MATITPALGARNALTVTGASTLASGTYVESAAYTPNTNKPVDVIVEVGVGTTNTPAANKQVLVFVRDSLDGTNYRTGPVSGTTSIDEVDLTYLGTVPLNTSLGTRYHVGTFSLANACGYVPFAFTVVLKNDVGVALTSATAFTSEITMTVA